MTGFILLNQQEEYIMEGITLSEFKQECEEFHILEKSVRPKRLGVEVALEVMREEIIEKARASSSLSDDPLEDLSIIEAGIDYESYYSKLKQIRRKLENARGKYVLIKDTSFQLFLNTAYPGHKCHSPFPVAAIGKIASDPMKVGFEEGTSGSHFYLKLMFENGAYIRECRASETKDRKLLSKVLRLIPSQQGTRVYRKKMKPLLYVRSEEDFERSYENIQYHYLNKKSGVQSRKPYWKIAPGKFKSHSLEIGKKQSITVIDYNGNTQFAMHIGNREVSRRLGLDNHAIESLDSIYASLNNNNGNGKAASLII
jgi:hypothetical protein